MDHNDNVDINKILMNKDNELDKLRSIIKNSINSSNDNEFKITKENYSIVSLTSTPSDINLNINNDQDEIEYIKKELKSKQNEVEILSNELTNIKSTHIDYLKFDEKINKLTNQIKDKDFQSEIFEFFQPDDD